MYDPLKADDAITNGELECISQCVAEKWGKLFANRWLLSQLCQCLNMQTAVADIGWGPGRGKNYTFALSSMSSCYVNFNGTRDDICLGTGCLISFPGRGGLPTWCNYDTALRGVGRVGLALFVLPLVDDLVCIASEK